MNAKDRKKVSKWLEQLEYIKADIEDMRQDEEMKFDNLPEGLQDSERGEAISEAMEILEEAVSGLDDVIGSLEQCAE